MILDGGSSLRRPARPWLVVCVAWPRARGRALEPVLTYSSIMGLIVALLVVWLILSILGFVIHGLFWLAVIGIVLFVATGATGLRSRR